MAMGLRCRQGGFVVAGGIGPRASAGRVFSGAAGVIRDGVHIGHGARTDEVMGNVTEMRFHIACVKLLKRLRNLLMQALPPTCVRRGGEHVSD